MIIVPDGLLTAVPWSALPGERPATFLIEQYALAVAPHAQFVLDVLSRAGRINVDQGSVLAVGGMPEGLPGAVVELDTISSLAKPRRVVRLQGETASVAEVLHSLPQAHSAPFATHGFFADPTIQSVLQADPDPLNRLKREGLSPLARNPLVLPGWPVGRRNGQSTDMDSIPAGDRGILTAEAIAGLPLKNLDLAVLSACETGLGTVASGEGVFGLQRAFHLAGTRTVIASLWAVRDRATQVLMAELYKNLWEKSLPKLDAMRRAAHDDQGLPAVHRQEVGQPGRKPGSGTCEQRAWHTCPFSGPPSSFRAIGGRVRTQGIGASGTQKPGENSSDDTVSPRNQAMIPSRPCRRASVRRKSRPA